MSYEIMRNLFYYVQHKGRSSDARKIQLACNSVRIDWQRWICEKGKENLGNKKSKKRKKMTPY